MTTFKENSNKINDEIQVLRNITLSTITRLKRIDSDENIKLIIAALELANLQAWKAQVTNNAFETIPSIEGYPNGKEVNEILNLEEYVCKILTQNCHKFYDIFELMESQFVYTEVALFDKDREKQQGILDTINYALMRSLDCMDDAKLWLELRLNRALSIYDIYSNH